MAIQPDGKVVVMGDTTSYDGDEAETWLAVARLNSDGSLDASFDGDGKLTDDGLVGSDLAVQADGKIVVVGSARVGASGPDFALVRYRSDGSRDSAFGSDGTVTTDLAEFDQAESVAIQADGRIVVAGFTYGSATGPHLALVRYRADGTLDSSFSGDGKLMTDLTGSARDMALQGDGKIVVADTDSIVARYTADGSLDSSFSGDGRTTAGIFPMSLAIQGDGRIVAAGFSGNDLALTRLNANGALDSSFGVGGIRITDLYPGSWPEINVSATGVAIQADGKLVVVGTASSWSITAEQSSWGVLGRYRGDGSLDPTFAHDGFTSTGALTLSNAVDVALQRDGKIVLAGSTTPNVDFSETQIFVARHEGDPVAANVAPTAQFAYSCSGLVCYVNAYGSTDPDGTIAGYAWEFGDGGVADGPYVRKVFGQYGTYQLRLRVTDNAGAGGTRTETVSLLRLTGQVSMVGAFAQVSVAWNGSPGALYWVYRGSKRVGAIVGTTLIDRPPISASGAYSYAVCEASGPMCSGTETLRLP